MHAFSICSISWKVVSGVIAVLDYFKTIWPTRKLWQINNSKDIVTIMSFSGDTHDPGVTNDDHPRPSTSIGQVQAYACVVESIRKAFGPVDFSETIVSNENPNGYRSNCDVILLGGCKTNHHTRLFFEEMAKRNIELPIVPLDDFSGFKWVRGDQGLPNEVNKRKVDKDYGIIMRTSSPFTTNKEGAKCFLFAGGHYFGTHAAALYFTKHILNDKTAKKIAFAKDNFTIVVEATIQNNGWPCDFKILYPISNSKGESN